MKSTTRLILIACLGLLAGCATAKPPMELVDARQAYARASAGQASQLAPAEVQLALEALTIAEQSFRDDPRSDRTRELAILAYRKAKLAQSLAVKATVDTQPAGAEAAGRK